MNYQYHIYRKNKKAFCLEFNKNKEGDIKCFATIANPIPNTETFAWKDPAQHIKLQLGLPELGHFLMILRGKKDTVEKDIFHKNPHNDVGTYTNLSYVEDRNEYSFKLARKELQLSINISLEESEIVRILFERVAFALCEVNY